MACFIVINPIFTQLPPNGGGVWRSYLRRIPFISPAFIYTAFFSLIQLLLNRDSYITPASIYAVLFSSLQLLFIRNSFHHSSFYLCSVLLIHPVSIYTLLFVFTPPSI